MMTGVFSIWSV